VRNIVQRRKGLAPTHPGELLREELLPATKLTQDALAVRLGVSRRTISEIVNERRSVSADMAHRLARFFNTTPELWLGLQQDVDLWKSRQTADREYAKIKPLRKSA
jgi:addiction module HigA family antidote